jgi:hypothetical protein
VWVKFAPFLVACKILSDLSCGYLCQPVPLPSYMQVMVKTFGLWKEEWEYMERMILNDCRNNSAWNQRAWLLAACIKHRLIRNVPAAYGGKATEASEEDSVLEDADDTQPRFLTGTITEWLQEELRYTRFHCQRTPHNESPWNYLNGLHYIVQDAVTAVDEGSLLLQV